MARIPAIISSALLLIAVLFSASLLPIGGRSLRVTENIHGVPFPKQENIILITEPHAHADVYLQEPVLAKQLELTITYRPVNLTSLAVGIREDSFWLSYGSKQEIFRAGNTSGVATDSSEVKETQITIPLTDKLQETDRSLDLMLFAEGADNADPLWELHDISANITHAKPTLAQFKDYARSILKRERAL